MLTKHLGLVEYEKTLNEMKNFTHNRSIETRDEIWILEHFPVYTIGSSYSDHAESDLWPGVPLVKSDRGGKLTYHGPGQLIIYVLLSLKKYQLTIRKFVRLLEVSVINLLKNRGVYAENSLKDPGVYADGKKICSLGLRVRHGYTYHGLSLNVDMDLRPFDCIDPCGLKNLKVTQTSSLGISDSLPVLGDDLQYQLKSLLENNNF